MTTRSFTRTYNRLRSALSITAFTSLVVICGAAGTVNAGRLRSAADSLVNALKGDQSVRVPAAGSLEVAFSPNEGSEQLVLKVIDSAQSDLRVLSYSFTSAPVVQAFIRARHRGVAVTLVADEKDNVLADRSNKSRAALGALANAGADVRVVGVFPIAHDKVIIADKKTVELGSYNYSDAAAHRNSENVLVNWDNQALASAYLAHFARNYSLSKPFVPASEGATP